MTRFAMRSPGAERVPGVIGRLPARTTAVLSLSHARYRPAPPGGICGGSKVLLTGVPALGLLGEGSSTGILWGSHGTEAVLLHLIPRAALIPRLWFPRRPVLSRPREPPQQQPLTAIE